MKSHFNGLANQIKKKPKNVRCSIKYVKPINYIVECISIIVIKYLTKQPS